MEALGYEKSMDCMLNDGLKIQLCVTDRHIQIRKLHREKYLPQKLLTNFMYITCQILLERNCLLAQKKRFSELAPWIKSVTNSLMVVCSIMEGNADELVEK